MLVYIILLAIFLPSVAHAWGPGTHLEIALGLLEKITLAAPVVRALIKAYPREFIYGSVSADAVIGKKYAGYLHHCHNWRVGRQILSWARTEPERAAAYGYLAHLASDVVAHNYYVPFKIIKNYKGRLFTHTYWELRFDLHVKPYIWNEMQDIMGKRFKAFDELLERVLKRALFSFKTSRRIFSGILTIQGLKNVRRALKIYSKTSRLVLKEEEVPRYRRLAEEAALDYLARLDKSPTTISDPTGIARLGYALHMRKTLRRCVKKKLLGQQNAEKFLRLVKDRLLEGIYQPKIVLPDLCLPFSQRS